MLSKGAEGKEWVNRIWRLKFGIEWRSGGMLIAEGNAMVEREMGVQIYVFGKCWVLEIGLPDGQ